MFHKAGAFGAGEKTLLRWHGRNVLCVKEMAELPNLTTGVPLPSGSRLSISYGRQIRCVRVSKAYILAVPKADATEMGKKKADQKTGR